MQLTNEIASYITNCIIIYIFGQWLYITTENYVCNTLIGEPDVKPSYYYYYNNTVSSQCNVTAQIAQVQDEMI
jgi:hypothetical protein